MALNSPPINILDPQMSLERVARFHRSAAGIIHLLKYDMNNDIRNIIMFVLNHNFNIFYPCMFHIPWN